MNKICTDIPQSKRLIELGININTADMYWWVTSLRYYIEAMDDGDFNEAEGHIPAWSLSALLDIIPQEIFDGEYVINITEGCDNRWVLTYDHRDNRSHSYYGLSTGADNLIDACYKMILKLKKSILL